MDKNDSTNDSLTVLPQAYLYSLAAWLVPGLGHLLLKRWSRAAILFLCVGSLVVAGYVLRGQAYASRGEDVFGILGYLAEIGTGAFYFLAQIFEPHGSNTARAIGDFGTRFLTTAGLLNYLCVLDVWEIAHRRKP
ncbi:MAG TPA: DUF6677 family protein [Candidatus Acidoferrales bacterium]|nr:DUF6677 family protein [Candidatus Acidoferrales bacterium]